jgi:diguanylate cyclase (GGDEF)-like protein
MLKRAVRRLVAPLILVCVLAGCSHAPQGRTLSVSELVKADSDAASRGKQVRTKAIVTYSDPDWRVLFLQDQSAAIYVTLPAGVVVQSGDQVQVSGTTTTLGIGLDNAAVSVLSKNNALPPPARVADYAALPDSLSSFVGVDGTVRWTGIKEGRPAVQLSSGGEPVLAYLRRAMIKDLPPLGSKVNLAGVDAADVDGSGRIQGVKLFVPSTQYIKVLQAGPSDPFSLPVTGLAGLNKTPAGTLVHVSGKISEGNQQLAITDGNLTVPLSLRGFFQGASADVVGFWTGEGLDDALARPPSDSVNRPPAESPAQSGDIVHLSQLKRLSEAEASAHRRVTVRAVVTYFDPDWRLLFVQDETAAAFVVLGDLEMQFRTGDLIDISGVSSLGEFAPVIIQPKVGFVGRAPLPAPFKADLLDSNLPAADSKWCTFSGVVHTAQEQGPHTNLRVGAGQTEITVQLPMLIHGENLVDREISVTGVFGVLFNDRRQAVGHQILVPSPEFLKVVDDEVQRNPPATIASLRRYTLDADEHHSVTLQGTVVLKSAPDTIFIQDNSAGIKVHATEAVDVADGDRVSVRGFITPGDYSPALEDAVVTRETGGDTPKPIQITAKTAQEGANDSSYVSMRGTLTAIRFDPSSTTLVLNDKGTFFNAIGPPGSDFSSLRTGSEIEVRGVCQVLADRFPFSIRGFTLAFDSPESVEVLKLGPWWDTRKIAWALVLIVVLAAGSSLWAALLQRQVEIQTRELQESLQSKRKAREFDIARNEVLESIARNAPLGESMSRLAGAIEQQIADSVCAIVMPPDGRSFLNGKPTPVLVAPGVPDLVQPSLLPVLASVLVPEPELDDPKHLDLSRVDQGHADGARKDRGHGDLRRSGRESGDLKTDRDLISSLLQVLSSAGLPFHDGQSTVVFSATGAPVGLLIIFLKNPVSVEAEGARQNILQSASRLIALARDHWHMQERLLHDARHDGLTGLPNRSVAEDRLEQALSRANRRQKLFAVVCIDLDGFKVINDSLGHHAGDELLRAVSTRLRSRVRHSDTVARIGGDEFLAIIEDCAGDTAAHAVAESLIAALQDPVVIEGQTLAISGSIGIAMYPADGKNAALLKRNADQAMYRAKSQGGNRICFCSAESAKAGKAAPMFSSSSSAD